MSAQHRPPRLSIRGVLLLGFGLTLGLWLFSGYSFTRRVTDLQRDSADVTGRYVRAQARMSAVRSQVLLASVYVRDALLDPQPESVVDYRLKLDEAFAIANRALSEYEPVLDTAPESERVELLRTRIDEFRITVLDVLGGDSTRWRSDALALLRDRIMPKRSEAVRVSEDVQALNRSAYVDQAAATSAIYRATQRRIWTEFGLALAASFVIGVLATRHVSKLERELRRQHDRDARTSADLQRLSAQIITAQEEERRAIARELHDEIGQALTAIKVELAVAERSMSRSERPDARLADVRALTETALQTVRDLSRLLHPAVLDDIGLTAAIDTYIREYRKRFDIAVDFSHRGMETRLPTEYEAAAYRIVQETLTNVARHAHAAACSLTLERDGQTVILTIVDDGVGFTPEADVRGQNSASGLGLLSIRERVTRLHGSCCIESSPGRGTRIVVTVPIRAAVNLQRDTAAVSAFAGRFADA